MLLRPATLAFALAVFASAAHCVHGGSKVTLSARQQGELAVEFTVSGAPCLPDAVCHTGWDFGDNSAGLREDLAASSRVVSHAFQQPGSYNVVVTLDAKNVLWQVVNLTPVSQLRVHERAAVAPNQPSQAQAPPAESVDQFFTKDGNIAIVASAGGVLLLGSGLAMYLKLRPKRAVDGTVKSATPTSPKDSDYDAVMISNSQKRRRSSQMEQGHFSDPVLSTRSPSTLDGLPSSVKVSVSQVEGSPETGSGQNTPSSSQAMPRNRARSNSNAGNRPGRTRRASYMGPRPEFINQIVAESSDVENASGSSSTESAPVNEWWKVNNNEWKPWLSSKILPSVFAMSCHFLLVRGLHVAGIFRIPGQMSEVKAMRADFEDGLQVDAQRMHDPLTIATLIKQEMRDSMVDIVPMNTYQALLDASRSENAVEDMKKVLATFTDQQRIILKAVMYLFVQVTKNSDKNGMDSETLAKAVGPSVFRNMHIASANALFVFCLNEYNQLF